MFDVGDGHKLAGSSAKMLSSPMRMNDAKLANVDDTELPDEDGDGLDRDSDLGDSADLGEEDVIVTVVGEEDVADLGDENVADLGDENVEDLGDENVDDLGDEEVVVLGDGDVLRVLVAVASVIEKARGVAAVSAWWTQLSAL